MVVGIAVAAVIAVVAWQLRGSSSQTASVPTATAVPGDVVVSVRALGKVVDARVTSRVVVATGAQATASVADGSQPIFPQIAGRVTALLVAPGQHLVAGQVIARLDSANARGNLVSAQASLDQARAQLEVDRSGVTPQSRASAKAAVDIAVATLNGGRDAVRHAVRVNRDSVAAAAQQVAQAKAQRAADRAKPGSSPQSTVAAEAAVTAAKDGLAGVRVALADALAVDAQQIVTAQHAVEAARRDLAADQSRLARDLATERRLCGINSPTITADTSTECIGAAAAVASDQDVVAKDQGAVQSTMDALSQTGANAAQSEHQARAQVAAAVGALNSARDQLSALRKANGQIVARDRQALAAARSGLAQARSKAAESTSQAQAQVTAASVGLDNARAASVALAQGAPGPLLAQDRSKIEVARALLVAARSALEQSVVRAPSGGTLTGVFAAQGSPVDVATPIVAMADLTHLAVSLDLSEFDAARVRPGLSAEISVDALGGKRYPGRVVFEAISGVDNGGVVTFPVRVALSRVAGVRIGMNVSARIIVARRRDVVTVPLEAVSRDIRGQAVVSVVDKTGRTSSRVVSLGLANNKDVEVTRGLRAGERVELQQSQVA